MMRPWLAIGGLVMIGVAVALAFGGWGNLLRPATVENTADTVSTVRRVEIDTNSDDVTVRSADVKDTTVQRKIHYRGDKPGRTFTSSGEVLRLDGCGATCSVDYVLTVPRGVSVGGQVNSGDVTVDGARAVDVESQLGDVRVTDGENVHVVARSGRVEVRTVAGPVRVETSSGDADLSDLQGPVQVKTTSGNVDVRALRGSLTAEASSGDVTAQLVGESDVRAHATSGSVDVAVPRGGTYRVTASTGGAKNVSVPNSATAAHLIDVTAGSGDVSLRAS